MRKFVLVSGGSALIDRDSVESAQTRYSGGVILRTKQGGVYVVDASIDEIEAWLSEVKK